MIASVGTITDMIINSLDYEKMLKDKLHNMNLEYILKLLVEKSDVTASHLLTFCTKERIKKVIEAEIDNNTTIAIKITANDKNRFATIVMDVIQSKNNIDSPTISVSDSLDSDPLASHTQSPPYHGADPYIESQSPPMAQWPPVDQFTPPPQTHEDGLQLHFTMDDPLDPLDSLINPGLDSFPLSQNMDDSVHNSNGAIAPSFVANPQSITESEDILVTEFEKKMKLAIKKNDKTVSKPSNTRKKKLITQQTSIHPQQSQKDTALKPPTIVQNPAYLLEFSDEEEEVPFPGMQAPTLNLNGMKNEQSEASFYPSANGQNVYQSPPQQMNEESFSHPTPRPFDFHYSTSPRQPQHSRTPAARPARISDPLLIRNALQGVAYYADKLDSLHSEYRRVYEEQQHYNSQLQSLDAYKMEQNEYNRRYQSIQSHLNSMSQTLQILTIGIYEQFQKMKQSLDTKYELRLDINIRHQFDKFQRYHDQFAATQHQLLVFGEQQQAVQQQQQQAREQQAQQQMYHPSYQVPPTPSYHQNAVKKANQWQKPHAAEHKMQYYQQMQSQQFNYQSVTPRGHGSYHYAQQQHQNYAPKQYPSTTTAIPERKFSWKQQTKNGMNAQQNKAKMSRTPRANNNNNNSNNGNNNSNYIKKSGDIPTMGYVYIGSRMSQLISHIALADREVVANQQRIEQVITEILKVGQNFEGFDIVSYGSSQHKLFIKDYSDFDFCIRCKTLGISHVKAIKYIADALKNKAEFEHIKVIDTVSESVHGHYLNDIDHISFFDTQSGRNVDLVLNNLPEIGASRFIAAYESIDPRFALLCRVVKYWSRQRKINDPINGTLSTYALVLMVINFLQLRRVLPTLSIMIQNRETYLSPWSTQDDYQINVQKYRDFASRNEEPHSRLLVNFFYFYAFKFNFNKDVVSVRTGTYLTKSEKKWNNDKHWICVENPFNRKTNLTQSVGEQSLKRIWAEFKRAYSILCDSYKIYEVCKLAE